MIVANLGGVPLKELARECGLSTFYFSRAFRRSVGVAPHRWLMARRIELAKEKLRDRRMSLTDVAAACGFSSLHKAKPPKYAVFLAVPAGFTSTQVIDLIVILAVM
jgi:AraC-like DNA-binding protein